MKMVQNFSILQFYVFEIWCCSESTPKFDNEISFHFSKSTTEFRY